MGSLFGGLLARNNSVSLIGRSEQHPAAIEEDGLDIEQLDGDVQTVDVDVTTDPGEVSGIDVLIVFVKSKDTEEAMESVNQILEEQPTVMTLQNGLGNPEIIAEFVPPEDIIVGTTSIGSIYVEPGLVSHTGAGDTYIGRYRGRNNSEVKRISNTLSEAGIPSIAKENIEECRWEKVLVNAGINAATALARVRNGLMAETDIGRALLAKSINEATEVASAEGVSVSDDIVDRAIDVASVTSANHSSMRQDIESNQETEIEFINGAIVERADEHGIDAPVNWTLTNTVRLAEKGYDS